MGYNITEVKKRLLSLSEEKDNYFKAQKEWNLKEIYNYNEANEGQIFSTDDFPACALCEHQPINEVCVIENEKNGNLLEIGNTCVKKFLSKETQEEVKKEIKKFKDKRTFEKNKAKFSVSQEYKKYETLDLILPPERYGDWRNKLNTVKKRVELKGAPTKKQMGKLSELYNAYENRLPIEIQTHLHLLEKTNNNWEKQFLVNMIKYRRTQDKMTKKQLKKYISINDKLMEKQIVS